MEGVKGASRRRGQQMGKKISLARARDFHGQKNSDRPQILRAYFICRKEVPTISDRIVNG